jgi:AcrR family transcriptional regulator
VPREVVKQVGGRAYRYRVESYRDAESGRARVRWTYLGKVDAADAAATIPPASSRRPDATRRRLLEALAALLERRVYGEVTASLIAAQAGCAHGTFYRHFRDKRAALDALFDDIRARVGRERPSFEDELGTLGVERARLGAYVAFMLRGPLDRPGLFRTFLARCAEEPELARARAEARDATVGALEAYLARLMRAAYCASESPRELARAVYAALDGIRLRAVFGPADFAEGDIGGVVTLIDRAVFAAP